MRAPAKRKMRVKWTGEEDELLHELTAAGELVALSPRSLDERKWPCPTESVFSEGVRRLHNARNASVESRRAVWVVVRKQSRSR